MAQNGCGYSRSKASDVARHMELWVGLGDDWNDAGERRRRRRARVPDGNEATAGYRASGGAGGHLREVGSATGLSL